MEKPSPSPQLHLDEKWDKAIDLTLRRFSHGLAIGGIGSLLLFRGAGMRTAVTAFTAGMGVGSAWQQVSSEFEDLVPEMLASKRQ
mmetsp:Transcript_20293/g.56542  ORF Transcript_20293/g.56542 Transcript_20293/m.56542 type:complete len:85 (+) Transcript_20293:800-1054(+)